jgi:ABC-type branched-subunit amino acid transport system permease subunit
LERKSYERRALDRCGCRPGVGAELLESTWALTLLSQIGIATIACLSFNLLLGQGGMLSFGHATYTGLGAYGAIPTHEP